MWGNALGWMISAVMAATTAAVFYSISTPQVESKPMGLISGAYQPIALSMPAALPSGGRDCEAGALYRQAIIHYLNAPKPYEDPLHARAGELSAINLVLQATDCGRMNLFESRPQQLVNYGTAQPELDALLKLGEAANTLGLGLLVDNKPDAARAYFMAAFALGRQLFQERVAWRELSAGLTLMSEAAQNLAKLADQTQEGARADVLRKFQEQADKMRTSLQETVASPLSNPVESYASKYAGDIFAIAMNPSVERAWRVQAILHLGRYRWNVADDRRGDQAWAERELKSLETSLDPKNADPVILTAVHEAQNLTLEEQRSTLRSD